MTRHLLILIILLTLCTPLWAEEFYIIYTANMNGMIENCGCGADPLGGISRVKSYIDRYKKDHLNVIVIDGGDFFNSYPYPTLNEAMYSSLLLMQYDCLVPGDQAFVEGESFFSRYESQLRDKIIITNNNSGYQTKINKNMGSSEVIIYGYLSPYIFEFIPKPESLKLENFVNAKPEPKMANQIQVAVVHGYLSNAEQFAIENPSIDLIFLAHDQRRGIWKKNQSTIIGNGKDSEYISVAKVNHSGGWKVTVEQIKIHEDLPEDEQIVKIVKDYKSN